MFQSTHPRRVRLKVGGIAIVTLNVSIHAPTKGATFYKQECNKVIFVSIHAPTKGATRMCLGKPTYETVSIHAPTKGATADPSAGDARYLVSIHAPTKGATVPRRTSLKDTSIVSIHAPTKGATPVSRLVGFYCMFQSTHPRRVRRGWVQDNACAIHVSIHAPTKGATLRVPTSDPTRKFQSTHPRRVRLLYTYIDRLPLCFNPRTHEGCDNGRLHDACNISVSIHAPTKGATPCTMPTTSRWGSFNPRTHEGCDVDGFRMTPAESMFQSTHPRRVRLPVRPCPAPGRRSFNPRTHEGCDKYHPLLLSMSMLFQSTHPRRVRHRLPYRR